MFFAGRRARRCWPHNWPLLNRPANTFHSTPTGNSISATTGRTHCIWKIPAPVPDRRRKVFPIHTGVWLTCRTIGRWNCRLTGRPTAATVSKRWGESIPPIASAGIAARLNCPRRTRANMCGWHSTACSATRRCGLTVGACGTMRAVTIRSAKTSQTYCISAAGTQSPCGWTRPKPRVGFTKARASTVTFGWTKPPRWPSPRTGFLSAQNSRTTCPRTRRKYRSRPLCLMRSPMRSRRL